MNTVATKSMPFDMESHLADVSTIYISGAILTAPAASAEPRKQWLTSSMTAPSHVLRVA